MYAIFDYLTGNAGWIALLLVFVVGVGILWPISDAPIRLRPGKLKLADIEAAAAQNRFTVQEAAFLWIGYQRPTKDAQVVAWIKANSRLEAIHSRLSKLSVEQSDGSFQLQDSPPVAQPADADPKNAPPPFTFARSDLERYAKRRASLFDEPVPEFLDASRRITPPPQA